MALALMVLLLKFLAFFSELNFAIILYLLVLYYVMILAYIFKEVKGIYPPIPAVMYLQG